MSEFSLQEIDAVAMAQRRDAFHALLVDAVASGASVGFVDPLSQSEVATFWRDVATEVARGERYVIVAQRAGLLVGCVHLVPSAKPNQRHRADVQKLLVMRAERGRGVGTRLMADVERRALAIGRWLLTLDTRHDSDAERLYRRLGWTEVGTIPDYAADPDRTLAACTFFYKRLATAGGAAQSDNG